MGLVPVVSATEWGEVAGAGRSPGCQASDVVLVALPRAAGAPGNTQCRSRSSTWWPSPGWGVPVDGAAPVEVDDGVDLDRAAPPHQDLICCSRTGRLRLSRRPTPPAPVMAAWERWTLSSTLARRLGGRPGPSRVAGEVEGELAAGDLADRDRAADVEGVLGAEVLELSRRRRRRRLRGRGRRRGRGCRGRRRCRSGRLAGVDPEPAVVGGGLLLGFGVVGHVGRDGDGDGVVELGEADLVGERRDRAVDVGGGLAGQGDGAFRDPAAPATPPGRPSGPWPRSWGGGGGARGPARRTPCRPRPADPGRWRTRRWRTPPPTAPLPGNRDGLVAVPVARGVVEGVDRVHRRPVHGEGQDPGLHGVR